MPDTLLIQGPWVLGILARDLSANFVPVFFPGDGPAQITVLSYVTLFYAIAMLMCRPYVDQPNNALEVWTTGTAFLICNYVGAMGFVTSAGAEIAGVLAAAGAQHHRVHTPAPLDPLLEVGGAQ